MNLALIILGAFALGCVALKIASKISVKREKIRWDKLTIEERRKEQESAYRQQAYGNW